MFRMLMVACCVLAPAVAFAQAGTGFEGKQSQNNPGDKMQTNPGAGAPCGKGASKDQGLGANTKDSSTNNPGGNVKGKDC